MLDLLYTIFVALWHSLETILNVITSIPTYMSYISNYMFNFFPDFLLWPLTVVFTVCVLIKIKRLVL